MSQVDDVQAFDKVFADLGLPMPNTWEDAWQIADWRRLVTMLKARDAVWLQVVSPADGERIVSSSGTSAPLETKSVEAVLKAVNRIIADLAGAEARKERKAKEDRPTD
jgi:hypothetical protein